MDTLRKYAGWFISAAVAVGAVLENFTGVLQIILDSLGGFGG